MFDLESGYNSNIVQILTFTSNAMIVIKCFIWYQTDPEAGCVFVHRGDEAFLGLLLIHQ